MSTESSVCDAARLVVGLDFGTSFSGFAFAHTSDPDHIYTFYDWPMQAMGGGRPYCKTITALYYKSPSSATSIENFLSTGFEQPRLEAWGWPALIRFSDDLHAFHRGKRRMEWSESPDPVPSVVNVGNYVTRFKLHLAMTTDQDAAGPSPASDLSSTLNLTLVVNDFLREIGEFIMEHLRGKYGKHLSKDVVQWCVTVPSIWGDRAK
jgi:hypothetical protein